MFTLNQVNHILPVLKSIKTCVDTDDTYTRAHGIAFNLEEAAGICWHVYAFTPPRDGVDYHALEPVFVEMGLNIDYPVERQLVDSNALAGELYGRSPNLYKGETGVIRVKLLEDLIKYFENILSKELA